MGNCQTCANRENADDLWDLEVRPTGMSSAAAHDD